VAVLNCPALWDRDREVRDRPFGSRDPVGAWLDSDRLRAIDERCCRCSRRSGCVADGVELRGSLLTPPPCACAQRQQDDERERTSLSRLHQVTPSGRSRRSASSPSACVELDGVDDQRRPRSPNPGFAPWRNGHFVTLRHPSRACPDARAPSWLSRTSGRWTRPHRRSRGQVGPLRADRRTAPCTRSGIRPATRPGSSHR
jgi:hypothetical protein